MKKQKAIIVTSGSHGSYPPQLNGLLEDGWRVVMATPFSGHGDLAGHPACLVIVEKDE